MRDYRFKKRKAVTVESNGTGLRDNFSGISKKKLTGVNIFITGIISYTLCFIAASDGLILSPAGWQGMEIIALILIVTGAVRLIKYKFDNKYLQSVFPIYLLVSISVIFRIQSFDYNNLKLLIFEMPFTFFCYLVPLVILFPRNLQVYRKFFNATLIFGVTCILFVFYYFPILHNPVRADRQSLGAAETCFSLAFPLGILLLTYIYHPKKLLYFAGIVLTISLYFLIYRARRGAMFLCLSTIAASGMIYLIYTKRTVLIIILSVLFALIGSVLVSNVKLPGLFDFLMERKDEDTRSLVEIAMKADMQTKDWLLGKGIDGSYFCPGIDEGNLTGYRNIIETGYLQIILKGGILSLILMALIILPAIYLGLFKSKNVLSKAAGMYALLWVVYLYPTVVTTFNFYYIMLWIFVGICYSKTIRQLPDITIKNHLQRFNNH